MVDGEVVDAHFDVAAITLNSSRCAGTVNSPGWSRPVCSACAALSSTTDVQRWSAEERRRPIERNRAKVARKARTWREVRDSEKDWAERYRILEREVRRRHPGCGSSGEQALTLRRAEARPRCKLVPSVARSTATFPYFADPSTSFHTSFVPAPALKMALLRRLVHLERGLPHGDGDGDRQRFEPRGTAASASIVDILCRVPSSLY